MPQFPYQEQNKSYPGRCEWVHAIQRLSQEDRKYLLHLVIVSNLLTKPLDWRDFRLSRCCVLQRTCFLFFYPIPSVSSSALPWTRPRSWSTVPEPGTPTPARTPTHTQARELVSAKTSWCTKWGLFQINQKGAVGRVTDGFRGPFWPQTSIWHPEVPVCSLLSSEGGYVIDFSRDVVGTFAWVPIVVLSSAGSLTSLGLRPSSHKR